MSDDGKRSDLVCTKVSERMAVDLLHMAVAEDRSVSDYLYRMIRLHLYGSINRGDPSRQSTKSTAAG